MGDERPATDTRYRERLYAAFADRSADFDEALDRALAAGRDRFGVELGFLTHTTDDEQRMERVVGDHDEIRPGRTCSLERAYCRRTVESDDPLCVQNATRSSHVSEQAVEMFGLGTYIGCRVLVNGETYGTVCFADTDVRETAFEEADELFVELLARLVGRAIERRRYERALHERTERLREEKQRFEGIAETTFDVLYRLDTEGRFTYVSAAADRLLGYDPESLVGTAFADYLLDGSFDDAMRAFGRLLDGETVERLELAFRAAGGDPTVIEVNAVPVYDDGDLTAIQGVARDVTTRKERSAELFLKNRAIDDAQVGITIADATDPDNPVVYANEAFERLTGYSESDIRGRNWRMLQGPGTDEERVDTLRRAIAAEEPVTQELLNYRRDGTPFWNRMTVTPVDDESGETTNFIGFQNDVTERKRSERLVELLNRVLRHNLRNEMQVLLGYGEVVADGEATDDVGERITDLAWRLVSLSEKARELETQARQERDVVRLSPDELCERVAADHRGPDARVDVDVDTDRDVCAGAEVERVLAELVDNAVTHDPSPPTSVQVRARDDDGWVELTVCDDGPGIPEMEAAVVERGLETPLEHGDGVGLWLVNWVVTRYGGSFQIRPREDGPGTVATIRLPGVGDDETVSEAARRPTTLFR